MSRFFLFCAAIAAAYPVASQGLSNCHQVIGATGKSATESGLYYAYTIGEPVVMTLKKQGINVVLTQGFHQHDVCLPVTSTNPDLWAEWDIQVYPNPVAQWLTVQYTAPDVSDLSGTVISPDGRTVLTSTHIPPDGARLDVSSLTAGIYILQLHDRINGGVSSVRFVKTQE
jgi:Secretion system C-terminal sorting domain